jgi:superfamily II DNA or RNA helicase
MDLIPKIKNHISEYRKDEDFKDFSDIMLIKIFFKQEKINIPCHIQTLLCTDHLFFEKIINLHENKFIKYYSDGIPISECLKKLSEKIIDNSNYKNKIKYINFDKDILLWLIESNFFLTISENINILTITENDVLEYIDQKPDIQEFNPRENQIEAFQHLEKHGLQTGIHCQATGCGKSYIILKYIGYTSKIKNPKIILFTERVNILADLFDFKKESKQANQSNILKWKTWGLCDLTNFEIINRVTVKKKDWIQLLNDSTKPTLLVINRAYLTLGKKYKELNKGLTLVLHDECHNTSSVQCHDFLLDCKKNNVPIIGFSATPVRAGKNDLDKLREIYAKEDSLNLLTDYNMIYSISKDLILPPEFHWYQFESYKEYKSNGELVSQEELGSVLEVINHIIPLMPNKKIIAWCGTIALARKWKELFEQSYKQRKNLVDFTFGLDTSNIKNDDYEIFKKSNGKSILFCASKHREGSDIRLLDACIFLDKVKDRGAIPFIQSIGRVLRKCPDTPDKNKGIIIDGIVKDGNNYERQFINKIFDYYLALENLSNITDDSKTRYEQYIEMRDIVVFDKEKETITMKLGKREININCNKIDWDEIVGKFDSVLQQKIKLSCDDNFKCKAQILKEKFGFHKNTNFVKEYKKISSLDKNEYNLPDIESDDYIKIFSNKSWFDFLEIEHDFYTDMNEAKNKLKKNGIKLNDSKKNWKLWCKLDNKLPLYPIYVWDEFKWEYFDEVKPNNMFL